MRSGLRWRLLALFVGCPFSPPAYAQYIVRTGDVLEIDVVGVSGLRQRLSVDLDGAVRVPLLGAVAVAGKSLDQINSLVQTRLSTKVLRQTAATGQEYQLILE